MKHFRRIVSAAMAAVMVFGCALTANAADSYTTMLKKGEEYTIIGKGVTNDGIVMNLNDKEKVVGIYYITIPEELRLPEYTVKVEDTPNPSDAEIDVFYNETLGMYGIRIIAKDLLDDSFTLRYITKKDGVNQAYAFKYVPLTVIDDDRFITTLTYGSEEYEEELDKLLNVDDVVNVADGIKKIGKNQSLVVDISRNQKIDNLWLKYLSKDASKSLICAGDSYALTFKGKDASYKSLGTNYKVKVDIKNTKLQEWEKKTGIKNVRPFEVTGMDKVPAKATLKLRVSGVPFRSTTVDLYKFENGKATKIANDLKTNAYGVVEIPGFIADGTYLISK